MNKIQVDGPEVHLENIAAELVINVTPSVIHLCGVNKITKISLPQNGVVTFHLKDQASLFLEDFWTKENNSVTMKINSENNTNLDWNLSIEALTDYQIQLENNMMGSYNQSKINVRVVTSASGQVSVRSIGLIKKDTTENKFQEELKGLMLQNQPITFYPDLIVDADTVTANHNATIRCISEEELFYLQSKGIHPKEAKKLIKDGFLNKIHEEVKK